MTGNEKDISRIPEKEHELINRYVYEVTKRVPKEQRAEIELELRELIDDMTENLSLEQVFIKLGDPAVFARKYREDKNYIIGPEYYDNFMWVMKIVLICTWGGLLVSTIVKCIVDTSGMMETMASFLGNIIMAPISAFGCVALVFVILERQKIRVDLKREKVWRPEMLNPIPDKKARISRGDCIVSIVFLILFSCLLIFAPQLFGAYSVKDGEVLYVPIFNMARWQFILPVFLMGMAAGFADEIIRLVSGCYCRIVMVSSIITNILGIIFSFIILKVMPFWNQNFAKEIAEQFDDSFKLKVFWENKQIVGLQGDSLSNIVLAIIVFASILEIATTVYKTMRYGTDVRGRN